MSALTSIVFVQIKLNINIHSLYACKELFDQATLVTFFEYTLPETMKKKKIIENNFMILFINVYHFVYHVF